MKIHPIRPRDVSVWQPGMSWRLKVQHYEPTFRWLRVWVGWSAGAHAPHPLSVARGLSVLPWSEFGRYDLHPRGTYPFAAAGRAIACNPLCRFVWPSRHGWVTFC